MFRFWTYKENFIVPVNGVIQAINHANSLYVRYKIFVIGNEDDSV